MIGGLGGLGRSITKYMVSKGARDFVFLQRTGTDKTPARLLVEDLTNAGVSAKVLKGDVCKLNDVEEAIAQANFPIGGVVQAAMGHDVKLSLRPKGIPLTSVAGIVVDVYVERIMAYRHRSKGARNLELT